MPQGMAIYRQVIALMHSQGILQYYTRKKTRTKYRTTRATVLQERRQQRPKKGRNNFTLFIESRVSHPIRINSTLFYLILP